MHDLSREAGSFPGRGHQHIAIILERTLFSHQALLPHVLNDRSHGGSGNAEGPRAPPDEGAGISIDIE